MTKVAERLRLTVSMLGNHRRGIRHARQMPTPAASQMERSEPSPLEHYFDGHNDGPGIWKWRHYFDVYHRHLQRFRGKQVHMVEVGVYAGGSIEMWREYFGPESHIYGVDIEPSCRVHASENVEIFIGDQSDPAFWADLTARVPEVDIVLDDGGHELEQQIVTLEALLPHVRPGGVYICEDTVGVANPFHDYVAGLSRNLHSDRPFEARPGGEARVQPTSFQRSVASVHIYPFITVIEKHAKAGDFELLRHGTEWPSFG